MGVWMVMPCPRGKVVMDMGMELAMVVVWRLYSELLGMWVVMAGPRAKVVMGMGMELDMVVVWWL